MDEQANKQTMLNRNVFKHCKCIHIGSLVRKLRNILCSVRQPGDELS